MSNAAASVVIPCFNSEAWIGETLESVFRQTGIELEVIVVDDGSTDGSTALVSREFPQVILHRQENSGVSAARNRGFALSTNPFIQFLDSDDLLEPGKLAVQARALVETPADIAYGDWDRIELRDGEWQWESAVTNKLKPDTGELDLFLGAFWAPPAAYLMTRDIVLRAGPQSATLPVIQDARFMLDCWLHGGRFVHCQGKMARYRVRANSLSSKSAAAFQRDRLTNAKELHQWWTSHGLFEATRQQVLLKVAASIADAAFDHDPALAQRAYQFVMELDPRYVPAEGANHWLSALFGFGASLRILRAKRRLTRALGGGR